MASDVRKLDELPPSEVTRLQAQQAYFRKALGFTVHPDVEASLASSQLEKLRILDISPVAQLEDLVPESKALTGHITRILPSNITTPSDLDHALSPLTEQQDLITISLLHTTLPSAQWVTTLSRLTRLLKPGGWLQWIDWDPSTLRIAGVRPGTPDATALRSLLRQYADALSARQVGTTYRIETSLKREGFVEIDSDMYPIAPEVEFTRNVVEGVVRELEEWGVLRGEEAGKVREEVGGEVEKGGVLIWWDLWCHLGRKAGGD